MPSSQSIVSLHPVLTRCSLQMSQSHSLQRWVLQPPLYPSVSMWSPVTTAARAEQSRSHPCRTPRHSSLRLRLRLRLHPQTRRGDNPLHGRYIG
jgi:hypothetical protein